jgi:hypothetical protein
LPLQVRGLSRQRLILLKQRNDLFLTQRRCAFCEGHCARVSPRVSVAKGNPIEE